MATAMVRIIGNQHITAPKTVGPEQHTKRTGNVELGINCGIPTLSAARGHLHRESWHHVRSTDLERALWP